METIVVISFELDDPEEIADVLRALDPSRLPGFTGEVRVAVDDNARAVVDYLDDGDELEKT